MRNIPTEYRNMIEPDGLIARCLSKAQERFPGKRLSFCGDEDNWEDCLGSCLLKPDGTELSFLFYFNVGSKTHAVLESVPL